MRNLLINEKKNQNKKNFNQKGKNHDKFKNIGNLNSDIHRIEKIKVKNEFGNKTKSKIK